MNRQLIIVHNRIIDQIMERPDKTSGMDNAVLQLRTKDLLAVKVKEKDA